MPRLVECVPNVSEGRRRDVIDRLAAAIRGVAEVRLLDQTSDADHNRSVFTFAGDAEAVARAAHALVDATLRELDMRTPTGAHPRLAVVVGARPPLGALNIELATTDLKHAQRIAKEVRESSGGLPAVQAKGFMLPARPRAQVSMNLRDHTTTSLATVWHEVEARANAA